jgi:hypothetical protein
MWLREPQGIALIPIGRIVFALPTTSAIGTLGVVERSTAPACDR